MRISRREKGGSAVVPSLDRTRIEEQLSLLSILEVLTQKRPL